MVKAFFFILAGFWKLWQPKTSITINYVSCDLCVLKMYTSAKFNFITFIHKILKLWHLLSIYWFIMEWPFLFKIHANKSSHYHYLSIYVPIYWNCPLVWEISNSSLPLPPPPSYHNYSHFSKTWCDGKKNYIRFEIYRVKRAIITPCRPKSIQFSQFCWRV